MGAGGLFKFSFPRSQKKILDLDSMYYSLIFCNMCTKLNNSLKANFKNII
jgi:hypothetical protein